MIKLTRLNHHVVAINPDHIRWAEATPDTTLFLLGGEKILVLESLEELMARVLEFRRQVRIGTPEDPSIDTVTGDPPRAFSNAPRPSARPPRPSTYPRIGGQ